VEGGVAAEAAAGVDVVGLAKALAGPGVAEDHVERLELVADALQLGVDLRRRGDVAVRQRAEIEPDTGAHAPVERDLVDRQRRRAGVLGRVVVPERVHVGAVVGRDPHPLDRPALALGQFVRRQAGEGAGISAAPASCSVYSISTGWKGGSAGISLSSGIERSTLRARRGSASC
jgi:hypothetical protein